MQAEDDPERKLKKELKVCSLSIIFAMGVAYCLSQDILIEWLDIFYLPILICSGTLLCVSCYC